MAAAMTARMMPDAMRAAAPSAYLMPKPECGPHLELLEGIIGEHGYSIGAAYPVKDWYALARDVYRPIIEESEQRAHDFEMHAWVLRHFFMNRALILTLEKEGTTLEEMIMGANAIKRTLRERLLGAEDGVAIMLVNLAKLPHLGIPGQRGTLGTYRDGTFQGFSHEYSGEWDFNYFKYAHCPDPTTENLAREWAAIYGHGVIDPAQAINEREWGSMKTQGTLVPPRPERMI